MNENTLELHHFDFPMGRSCPKDHVRKSQLTRLIEGWHQHYERGQSTVAIMNEFAGELTTGHFVRYFELDIYQCNPEKQTCHDTSAKSSEHRLIDRPSAVVSSSCIASNYVVLASSFINHRGNQLFGKLSHDAFESYGTKFSPSWIAKRVVDGVSKHNPPLIFCLPDVENPTSISDLVPLSQTATIDIVFFVLRMWHIGQNGNACLQRKLVAIEDLLVCQGRYSADDLHEALFLYGRSKKGDTFVKEQKKGKLDSLKSVVYSTTHLNARKQDNPETKPTDWQPTTGSSDVRLGGSDDTVKGGTRKRRSVDGCDCRNHDSREAKKTWKERAVSLGETTASDGGNDGN